MNAPRPVLQKPAVAKPAGKAPSGAELPFWKRPIMLPGMGQKVPRMSGDAMASLIRQMATLAAVIPISDAVATLARQPGGKTEKAVLAATHRALQSGTTLAAALPAHFPPDIRATVAAGEASGKLPLLLNRLADTLEAQAALRSKLVAAMAYPALLILVALAVIVAMLLFVVPSIAEQLVATGQTLPFLTRAVLAVSEFFQAWWWLLLLGVVAAGLAIGWAMRQPASRRRIDGALLRVPLIGPGIAMAEAVRLARMLATMLAAGLPLAEALSLTAPTLRNSQWREGVHAMAAKVRGGSSLSATLPLLPRPPGLLVALVQSGESSGRLVPLLESAATSLDRQLSDRSRTVLALAEPLIIVSLGAIVGLIILAVLLPILQLNTLAGAPIGGN